MEEKCPLCSNHCLKTHLQCGRGKHYFENSHIKNSQDSTKQNDLTSKLMKCGQILMHKTGKKHGQENILEILFQYESISQKQLQEILGVEAGSLSEILSKIEQRQYIKRYKDEKDKRKSIISLTEKGKLKIQNKKTNDEDMFDMLTKEEKVYFEKMLDKILISWYERHMKYHKDYEK